MTSSKTIAVGVSISNKGCRLAYTNTECHCPEGRCWVAYARGKHRSGEAAPTFEEWLRGTSPPVVDIEDVDGTRSVTYRACEKHRDRKAVMVDHNGLGKCVECCDDKDMAEETIADLLSRLFDNAASVTPQDVNRLLGEMAERKEQIDFLTRAREGALQSAEKERQKMRQLKRDLAPALAPDDDMKQSCVIRLSIHDHRGRYGGIRRIAIRTMNDPNLPIGRVVQDQCGSLLAEVIEGWAREIG